MWLTLLILLIALGAVFFFWQYSSRSKAKQKSAVAAVQKAAPVRNTRPLTPLQRSWVFLHRITKIVVSKFSRKDQEAVLKLGHKLFDMGVQYRHVVDMRRPVRTTSQEVTRTQQHAGKEGEKKGKEKSRQ